MLTSLHSINQLVFALGTVWLVLYVMQENWEELHVVVLSRHEIGIAYWICLMLNTKITVNDYNNLTIVHNLEINKAAIPSVLVAW